MISCLEDAGQRGVDGLIGSNPPWTKESKELKRTTCGSPSMQSCVCSDTYFRARDSQCHRIGGHDTARALRRLESAHAQELSPPQFFPNATNLLGSEMRARGVRERRATLDPRSGADGSVSDLRSRCSRSRRTHRKVLGLYVPWVTPVPSHAREHLRQCHLEALCDDLKSSQARLPFPSL